MASNANGSQGKPIYFPESDGKHFAWPQWKSPVPYSDDCIISSRSPEEHISRLREIFQRFHNANLTINPAKCAFFQTKVKILDHIVSKDGLQVDTEKVDVVKRFPTPKNQTEVKSFLGLASYYRRYVSNFAAIARPLHKARETSSLFTWTEKPRTLSKP